MRTTLEFMAAMLLMAVLFIAQLDPANPLFWLASLSIAMMAVRIALLGILLWFIIAIPENRRPRMFVGLATLTLCGWVIGATIGGTLDFIDTVILVPAIMAILGALLETKPEEEPLESLEFATAAWRWLLGVPKVLALQGVQFGWLVVMDVGLAIDDLRNPNAPAARLAQPYGQLEDSATLRVRHV